MNGFQFAKWLRDYEQTENHPFQAFLVACSANVSNKDQQLYKEYGFNIFLEKPINIKKLDKVLEGFE